MKNENDADEGYEEPQDSEDDSSDFLAAKDEKQSVKFCPKRFELAKHYRKDRYFKLRRTEFSCMREFSKVGLKYMVASCFDEVCRQWIVAESRLSKLLLIKEDLTGGFVVENSGALKHPTALCPYIEGEKLAVLCSETPRRNYMVVFYTYPGSVSIGTLTHENRKLFLKNECRGLAKTVGGNLLTMQRDGPNGLPSLRLFSLDGKCQTFDLPRAGLPSFMDAMKKRVVISDLGVQRVFLIELDDEIWKHTQYTLLRTIQNGRDVPRSLSEAADRHFFYYVSRPLFDEQCNIMIADAQGYSIKIYDSELNFFQRVNTDFAIPYISSWTVNKRGDALIIDLKKNNLLTAHLGTTAKKTPWVRPREALKTHYDEWVQHQPKKESYSLKSERRSRHRHPSSKNPDRDRSPIRKRRGDSVDSFPWKRENSPVSCRRFRRRY